MKQTFTSILILLILPLTILAEGTREMAPNGSILVNGNQTTDIAALLINHAAYGSFAHVDNDDPYSRLYINIQNPDEECIYLGFSYGHLNYSGTNPPARNFTFVIKDPDGNIVYGPHQITRNNANIQTWRQGYMGPEPLVGSEGYVPIVIDREDLLSKGWSGSGDYYIEFDAGTNGAGFLIDFWDISVINCSGTFPQEKKGRVWSYNWALFAVNDYGFPDRPFNGSFYTCAPDGNNTDNWFISKIDFNQSGFKPAAFNIAFNSFGTRNTGDIAYDRKSVHMANMATPEYPIFLNDPVDILQTADLGEISFQTVSRLINGEFCINVIPTKTGQIEILLDLDGDDGIYTDDSRDLLLAFEIADSMLGELICIPWNGIDGLGDEVLDDSLSLIIAFNQGIYHFPVYDAELMENGFNITNVRPAGPPPLLYYDDSEIQVDPGTGEPKVNLNGCVMPCHTWTTYIDPDLPGYGNLNTLNSWWFANTNEVSIRVALPNVVECSLYMSEDLCRGRTDTIYVELNYVGSDNYTVLAYEWLGNGIHNSTEDYAVVDVVGAYSYELIYINTSGDTLTTSCSIELFQSACPDHKEVIKITCIEDLPEPLSSIEDFINSDYYLGDTSCLNFAVEVNETDNGGSGCGTDSLIIIREYTIFHDGNENGILDSDEAYISCSETYLLLDTTTSSLHFINPYLEGMESGDTLRIQCRASEIDWEMPQFSEEDLAYANDCSEPVVTFSINKMEDGECSQDGFISRYSYQWDVAGQCDTASIFIVVEMVDTLAPQFISAPRDTAVFCNDVHSIPAPLFEDECCCASLEYEDVAADCEGGQPVYLRTWTLSDACGNTTELQERIRIMDPGGLDLIFVDSRYSNGDKIRVNCFNGSYPPEMRDWDENMVISTGLCSDAIIHFQKERIRGLECQNKISGKWVFTWTAEDECGNSESFVLYLDIIDNEAPAFIRLPEENCGGFPALDDYEVIENCSRADVEVIVEDIDNPACPELRQKRYTYIATDLCGNSTRVVRIYSEGVGEAPIIGFKNIRPDGDNSIYIDCGSDRSISGIYSRDAVNVRTVCTELADLFFSARTLSEGKCVDGVYKTDLLEWIAVDECGNSAKLELKVKYRDLEAPEIVGFQDEVFVSCPGEVPVYTRFYDCNDATIVVDEMDYVEDCSSSSIATRTIVVEDICGNSNTYYQTVHINREESVYLMNGEAIICESGEMKVPVLHDLCYDALIPAEYIGSERVGDCNDYFKEIKVWKIKNVCGQESIFYQKVLRDDAPTPQIVISHPELGDLTGVQTITVDCEFEGLSAENFTFENSCGVYSASLNTAILQDVCINRVMMIEAYTYEISDNCGNIYSATIELEYIDNQAPVFEHVPADMTISCADNLPEPKVIVTDNCSDPIVELTELPVTNTGKPGITRIWRALDACGNVSTAMQVIEIDSPLDCYIDVPDDIDCWSSTEIEVIVRGGTEPYTYKWETVSGECLIQQTTDSPKVRVTILSDSAEVKVTIIDANGCETECTVVLECNGNMRSSMSGNDFISASANGLLVYPNPSKDVFYIKAKDEIEYLAVYSVSGQLVRDLKPGSQNVNLQHNFLSGVYYMEVHSSGTVEYVKVVVSD